MQGVSQVGDYEPYMKRIMSVMKEMRDAGMVTHFGVVLETEEHVHAYRACCAPSELKFFSREIIAVETVDEILSELYSQITAERGSAEMGRNAS